MEWVVLYDHSVAADLNLIRKIDVKIRTDHLPFPMPQRPHSFIQQWRHLSFLHWEVDPVRLAPYIPEGLELDIFEEKAYIGIIPFMMTGVSPRLALSVPGLSLIHISEPTRRYAI